MESDSEGIESRLEETGEASQDKAESEVVEYLSRREIVYSRDNKSTSTNKKNRDSLDEKIIDEARESEIDAAEYFSSVIAERQAYARTEEGEKKETNRGSAAIIYNKGTGEFYFELKPDSYPIKEARGKLALVGGHVEHGENSLDALIREIEEEVVDPKAQIILKAKLTQLGTYYYTIVEIVNGQRIETDVYLIDFYSDNKEWRTVRNSSLTEGLKQVLKYDEIHSDDFAFRHEEPLIKLLNEGYKHSHRTQGIGYAMPIDSIINNHSQLLNQSFPSRPYEDSASLRIAA